MSFHFSWVQHRHPKSNRDKLLMPVVCKFPRVQHSKRPLRQYTSNYRTSWRCQHIRWCTHNSFDFRTFFFIKKLACSMPLGCPHQAKFRCSFAMVASIFASCRGTPKKPGSSAGTSNPTVQALSCLACSPISSTSCHGNATLL